MSSHHDLLSRAKPKAWQCMLASGMTIRGLEQGREDAPVLLAVHGWLDNAASFEGLGELLASDYRVIAIDLPGHGLSDHPSREGVYHFVNWCVWLDEILELLPEPVTLLGHSMGAAIVMCYAGGTHRELTRVIAIDGIAPGTTPASQTAEQFARGIKSRTRALKRSASRVESLQEAVEKMRAVRMPMGETSLHAIASRHLRQDEEGMYFGYDPMLQSTSIMRLAPTQVRALFAAVRAPVHLIRASEGWPVDAQEFEEMISWIEAPTRLDRIQGGHHVHMDDPEGVHALIIHALHHAA